MCIQELYMLLLVEGKFGHFDFLIPRSCELTLRVFGLVLCFRKTRALAFIGIVI